jgi:hypothetical protein
MKIRIICTVILLCSQSFFVANAQGGSAEELCNCTPANPLTIAVAREFMAQFGSPNSIPFAAPLAETINATANSRFYTTAFIPKENSFYFRFSLNGMLGFVRDDQKSFNTVLPWETPKGSQASIFSASTKFAGRDTVGAIMDVLYHLLNQGYKNGTITNLPPRTAATIFGNQPASFKVDRDELITTLESDPTYQALADSTFGNPTLKAQVDSVARLLPNTTFDLPPGLNISALIAAVPQIEIGSFMGTELLVRFIPQLNWGEAVGEFGFWGLGLKHSISQYFNKSDKTEDRLFDLAVQAVYQQTTLNNTYGESESNIKADAQIMSFNIHGSKTILTSSGTYLFDVYGGAGYESLNIDAKLTSYLPVTLQAELGLRTPRTCLDVEGKWAVVDEARGCFGDDQARVDDLSLKNSSIRATLGVSRQLGPISIFFDYSISQFNILSGGIQAHF